MNQMHIISPAQGPMLLHFARNGRSPTIPAAAASLLFSRRRLLSSSATTLCYLVLRDAADSGDLRRILLMHGRLITTGRSSDVFLSNNLLTAYSKTGSLSAAQLLFDHIPHRDAVSYNSLLSAYALHGRAPEAFSLFCSLLRSAFPLTALSFTPILKLCSLSYSLFPESRAVHCLACKNGSVLHPMVSSSLVWLYSKFGAVDDARLLFDEMWVGDRDSVLWSIMIKAYKESDFSGEAFLLFAEMNKSGIRLLDHSLWSTLMAGEISWNSAQLHGLGIKVGTFEDGTTNLISWNRRMTECLKASEYDNVVDYFLEMRRLGVECDIITFIIAINSVSGVGFAEVGQQIHGLVLRMGFLADVYLSNNLINMYSKVDYLDSAGQVFDEMNDFDLVSWNSIISSYAQGGMVEKALDIFSSMVKNGTAFDHYTLASVFRACSGIEKWESLNKQIHALAEKTGLLVDNFVLTALVDSYARRGCMEEAEFFVNSMYCVDIACYNALISGYVVFGYHVRALDLFLSMQMSGETANNFTLATVLKACACLNALNQGRQIHAYAIRHDYDSELCLSSAILDMYMKCGHKDSASLIFNSMHEPDDVAWTTMISGCADNGVEEYALSLYHRMRQMEFLPDEFTLASLFKACSNLSLLDQGRQIHANAVKLASFFDVYVGTSILDMYAKCGSINDSYRMFNRMCTKSISSWNAMVVGLAQHGKGKEALNLFDKMISNGLKPDKVTYVGVLSACSHSGLVSEAHRYFDSMQDDYGISPEIEHYSCLIDALGRAGRLSEAENIIEKMPFEASVSTYNSLLGACRLKGNTEIGGRVATKLLSLDPFDSSAYVLLSNLYAAKKQWDGVDKARHIMKTSKVKKDPGCSWLDVKNKVHMFVVNDRSHPEVAAIYDKLEDVILSIKEKGYIPDVDFALHDVEEEEKQRSLYYHSEKLAIAYGLISIPMPMDIRVIKNLRVCGDCHTAIKYISKVFNRNIMLRDANRFHHFSGGICSCGDYW